MTEPKIPSHMKFYAENREKILAYKKEFYANKTGKKTLDYLRNIQIIGMTKLESNKTIKEAFKNGTLGFQYVPSKDEPNYKEMSYNPTQWIADCKTIRTDVKPIPVEIEYINTQGKTWLILVFHPWMFEGYDLQKIDSSKEL